MAVTPVPAAALGDGEVVDVARPIARELARNGSRYMTIAPGIAGAPTMFGMLHAVQDALAAGVPCPGRQGTPLDCARLVKHIVENEVANGEVVRLDEAIRLPSN